MNEIEDIFLVKNYISKYQIPKHWVINFKHALKEDFDILWLLKTGVSPFSRDIYLFFDDGLVNGTLDFQIGDSIEQRHLSELWWDQICELSEFVIYDLIFMSTLIFEDEDEKCFYDHRHNSWLKNFELFKNKINAEEIIWKIRNGSIV